MVESKAASGTVSSEAYSYKEDAKTTTSVTSVPGASAKSVRSTKSTGSSKSSRSSKGEGARKTKAKSRQGTKSREGTIALASRNKTRSMTEEREEFVVGMESVTLRVRYL